MKTRTYWLFAAPMGLLLSVAPALAQQTTIPAGPGGIKTYDAEKKDPKAAPKAADLKVPIQTRGVEALAEDKREAQIMTLSELIEMKEDSDPEKPELYMRMADLYWEKAESFENKANDTKLETAIFEAEQTGDAATADRFRREQQDYFAKQKQWQDKAVAEYQRIEETYPTYKELDKVLYYLAYNLGTVGRGEEALQYYVKLASDFPDSRYLPDALFNVGEFYFDQNQFDSALVFYEKVANFPESLVYGFALYKQGWCHYNMGDFDLAFESFLAVVRYSDDAARKGKKLPIELKREAQKDLVTTYSQVGTADKALAFFKTVDPENYLTLGANLAELYTDQGKFDQSSRLLQTIIKEDPGSHRVVTYQRIIVMNADKRGVKDDTAKEAERLIGLYRKLSTTAPPEYVAEEKAKLDSLLRVLATQYHQEHEKTSDQNTLTLSRRLYGVYVELFPESSDAYEMHRNYGVLLYQQKEYEKAVKEFEKVIEIQANGPHTPEAAYLSLLCYFRLFTLAGTEDKAADEGADLAEKELPELEAKMVNAADRFVKIASGAELSPEQAEDVPRAEFAAAKILYDYNHFKEAIPRFRNIIERHINHFHARDAARLLLSAYHLARDIRNLNKWADTLSGKPQLMGDAKLAGIIRQIRDRAEYNTCFQYENEKRYLKAADCFVRYVEKFPGTELMDKAYYYAAVNYDKARLMEKSIETFVMLYNRTASTKSPLAPKALFAVGKVYHHAAVYSEASRYYELYVEKHPKDEYVKEALQHATRFRKSLGDYEKAIADLNLYLKLFPKDENVPQIYFEIGNIYEKIPDYKKVQEHFQAYIDRYGKRGPVDLALLARIKIAKAIGRGKTQAAQDKAAAQYAKLVDYFNKLDKKEIEKVTVVGLAAVAESRFIDGDRVLAKAFAIEITRRNMETALAEKLKIIAEAKTIFEDVYSFEHPHWQIAALNRVGSAYAELADTIENSPCPAELNEEQCQIYKDDLAMKADQIRQSAIELFRKCLETARTQHWFNKFSDEAEQKMAEIDYTYRFTKEFRARPIYTRAAANPPAFLFGAEEKAEDVTKP